MSALRSQISKEANAHSKAQLQVSLCPCSNSCHVRHDFIQAMQVGGEAFEFLAKNVRASAG